MDHPSPFYCVKNTFSSFLEAQHANMEIENNAKINGIFIEIGFDWKNEEFNPKCSLLSSFLFIGAVIACTQSTSSSQTLFSSKPI